MAEESDTNADEIDMVVSMYDEVCYALEDEKDTIRISLPFRFVLDVQLPPASRYPEEVYPTLRVQTGPNSQLLSTFSTELNRRMKEEIPVGVPMLAMLLPIAQALAEELQDEKEAEAQEKREMADAFDEEMEEVLEQMEEMAIDVWAGDPIVDRRSKFVAHMAHVTTLDEVHQVVGFLRQQRHIAMAAHPTIWAYRYTDSNGILHQDCDDDGEHGASVKMMFLLDQLKVDGYVIIVTRWFGGILLGPDRFKHIMEVSKNMLVTIPQREEERAKKEAKDAATANRKKNAK